MTETKEAILREFKEAGGRVALMLLQKQQSLSQLKTRYKDEQRFQGVVSEADDEAEKLILGHLREKFPEIPVLSEEMAHRQGLGDYRPFQEMPQCFVVDPLDGSNNFVHGLDYFCISLALVRQGEPEVGFVLRPSSGESFSALAGEGAWHQASSHAPQKKLCMGVQDRPLVSCLISTAQQLPGLDRQIHSLRQMGSAALDLCYVAVQKFDGYCARGLSPWDAAAAAVVLREANVMISDFQGKKWDCFGRTFLAAPSGIHQQLQRIL